MFAVSTTFISENRDNNNNLRKQYFLIINFLFVKLHLHSTLFLRESLEEE